MAPLGHGEHRLYGTITHLHQNGATALILGDDGHGYFLHKKHMASYGTRVLWRDLKVTMRVSFLGVPSDRAKDLPVALECRVTDLEMPDGI